MKLNFSHIYIKFLIEELKGHDLYSDEKVMMDDMKDIEALKVYVDLKLKEEITQKIE